MQKQVRIAFALILDEENCKEIAAVVFQPPTVCVRRNCGTDDRQQVMQKLGYADAVHKHEHGQAPPATPVPDNSNPHTGPGRAGPPGPTLQHWRHDLRQHMAPSQHRVGAPPIAPNTPPALRCDVARALREQQSRQELHAGAGPAVDSAQGQHLSEQRSRGDAPHPHQLQLQGNPSGSDPRTSGILAPSISAPPQRASPWHRHQSARSQELRLTHGHHAYRPGVTLPSPTSRQTQRAGHAQPYRQQLPTVAANTSGRDKQWFASAGHAGSMAGPAPSTAEPRDGGSLGVGCQGTNNNCASVAYTTGFPQGSAAAHPRHSPLQPGVTSLTDQMHARDASVLKQDLASETSEWQPQSEGLQAEQDASIAHSVVCAHPTLANSAPDSHQPWRSTQHSSDVGTAHPAVHAMLAESSTGQSSNPQALQAQFRDMRPEQVAAGGPQDAHPGSHHTPFNAYMYPRSKYVDTGGCGGSGLHSAEVQGAVPGSYGGQTLAGAPDAVSTGIHEPWAPVPGALGPVGGLTASTSQALMNAEVYLEPAKAHENQSSFCHVPCWEGLEGFRAKRPRYDDPDDLTVEEFNDALV